MVSRIDNAARERARCPRSAGWICRTSSTTPPSWRKSGLCRRRWTRATGILPLACSHPDDNAVGESVGASERTCPERRPLALFSCHALHEHATDSPGTGLSAKYGGSKVAGFGWPSRQLRRPYETV